MAKKVAPVKKASAAKPRPSAPQATGSGVIHKAIEAGEGILRLAPTWVPRSFLMPGRRIKLAPQDIYALGAHRGGMALCGQPGLLCRIPRSETASQRLGLSGATW